MNGAALWARNDIRTGWRSLLMVALMVAIAGGAVMAGVAGARRAGASIDRFLADSGFSDVTIYTESPLDPALRAELRADPRITDLADMRVVLATPTTVSPGLGGVMLVVPDEYFGDLVRPRLVSGTYPSGSDEIAMTEMAADLGFEVGERVDTVLLTPAGLESCIAGDECLPEAAGTVTITAIIRGPGDLAPDAFGQGVFLAPTAFLDARGGDASATGRITDVFLTSDTVANDVVNDYSTKIDNGDIGTSFNEVAGARRAADVQRDALLIGTAIAAAAGILIAGQGFGRFLSRRSAESATLAALGMPTGQRVVAGWMPGLAAAALGAALAVPAAIALSPMFPLRAARRADPDVGVNADLQVLIVGALITFAFGAGASLLSAWIWCDTTKRSNGAGTTVSTVNQLAVRLGLPPVPTMGSRFALERGRGARRTPVFPALVGSAAAVAVIVGALVLAASLDGLLTTPARYGAPWDLQVGTGDELETVRRLITDDPRVSAATMASAGELNISVNGAFPDQVSALGIESLKGSIEPVVLEGRAPAGPDEVVGGSATLDRLDLDVGDVVELSGPGGARTMTIVGRTIVPIVGNSLTDEGIVVPHDAFRTLGGADLVAAIDDETVILTRLVDGADVARFRTELEADGRFVDGTFRQSSVSVLTEVRGIPFYVAAFTGFIGALAVLHALIVTARRRRRDLAVMRAIGCRGHQTSGVIHWQGFFLAVAAIALGVPLGLIGGRLLWTAIAEGTNVLAVIETPWAPIAIVATAAVLGAAFMLAAGPAWAASRRRPASDLRAE